MAELVPELARMPSGLMLDGELVSFERNGRPSFDHLGRRMLMRRRDVPVCFVAFDLLAIDGTPTIEQPYRERRAILEAIEFGGPCWATVPAFDDGDALWHVVIAQQLEGIVAKRLNDPYVPGDRRLWVKVKSPAWPRRTLEREAMAKAHERRRRTPQPS
jgi:bifunctional non-homologous end joining protein LigD